MIGYGPESPVFTALQLKLYMKFYIANVYNVTHITFLMSLSSTYS
jgi:hypothetical protein